MNASFRRSLRQALAARLQGEVDHEEAEPDRANIRRIQPRAFRIYSRVLGGTRMIVGATSVRTQPSIVLSTHDEEQSEARSPSLPIRGIRVLKSWALLSATSRRPSASDFNSTAPERSEGPLKPLTLP